jgi:hypothetical protein
MPITQTVTWADLRAELSDELSELRDAYDEIRGKAIDEYGEDAFDRTLPDDPDTVADENRDLWTYQRQIEQYNQAKQSIDRRLNVLERLEDEVGSGDFEIKMLTGSETMEIETRLRLKAQERNTDVETIQHLRELWVVDGATVDAPDGVPREDGSPQPSECPNALATSLYERINRLNNAGATDFQTAGFGDPDATSPTTDA